MYTAGRLPDCVERPIPFDPCDADPTWWPIGPRIPPGLGWNVRRFVEVARAVGMTAPWSDDVSELFTMASSVLWALERLQATDQLVTDLADAGLAVAEEWLFVGPLVATHGPEAAPFDAEIERLIAVARRYHGAAQPSPGKAVS